MAVYVVYGPKKMPQKFEICLVTKDEQEAKQKAREVYEKYFSRGWYGWANRTQIKRYVSGRDEKTLHEMANKLIEKSNRLELTKMSMKGDQKVVALGRQTAYQKWAGILRSEKDIQC